MRRTAALALLACACVRPGGSNPDGGAGGDGGSSPPPEPIAVSGSAAATPGQLWAGVAPGAVAPVSGLCPVDHPVLCGGGSLCCSPGDVCAPDGGCQATNQSTRCGSGPTPYPCSIECCPADLRCNAAGTACAQRDAGAGVAPTCDSPHTQFCGDGCCSPGEQCGPPGKCNPNPNNPSLGCSNSRPCGNVCVCDGLPGLQCVSGICHRDGGVASTCPAAQPDPCQGGCCASGTCGSGCGCPTNAPVSCDGVCCPAGAACLSGAPQPCAVCPSDYPVGCGANCCLPGAACVSGVWCGCPPDLPVACRDRCGPVGSVCLTDGGFLQCPGFAPVICGATCCGSNDGCVNGQCLLNCGPGTHQEHGTCVPNDPGTGSCNDGQHALKNCPDGSQRCCSIHMECCHDSANGGAIGCEFAGFCQ